MSGKESTAVFEIQSSVQEGILMAAALEWERPFALSQQIFLFADQTGVREIEEGLSLFSQAKESPLKVPELLCFASPLVVWVEKQILRQAKVWQERLDEEARQLNTYFVDVLAEIRLKKKSMYYHNYYFEREKQIDLEIEGVLHEIEAARKSLLARQELAYKIRILGVGYCHS